MKGAILRAYRFRGPVLAAAAAVLIVVALSAGVPLGEGARQARGVLGLIALSLFAVCAVLTFVGPRLLPQTPTLVVTSPVRGRWLGMNSPASRVPSHGIRMYGQAYAIDLVYEPTEAARPVFGDGSAMRAPEDYPAFGQPVFAMIEGTVVRATDWRRDHRARSNWLGLAYMMVEGAIRELGGPGFILGNHVIVRGANGEYAALAHLQQGSLRVRVGETVRAGQQLARCGNSGNSSEPHVHAQLMDRVAPVTAQGVPMAFADILLREDAPVADALPENGQHMIAGPSGE